MQFIYETICMIAFIYLFILQHRIITKQRAEISDLRNEIKIHDLYQAYGLPADVLPIELITEEIETKND